MVRQLLSELSSPVLKLLTRKMEESQLACKRRLMTCELFSCRLGYWEGHAEINFLHLVLHP